MTYDPIYQLVGARSCTFGHLLYPWVSVVTVVTCLQDGWDAKKLTEHMETYLQKKASDSESEARSGQAGVVSVVP